MEVKGTIVSIEPIQDGTGKNGTWKKRNVIIKTEGEYPKDVCLTCFDKILSSIEMLSVGQNITAAYNLESRQYNERWYTEVKMWKFLINN